MGAGPPDVAPLPPGEPERSLRWSIVDACANAAQLGAGEVYLVPCAIALGAGAATVGVLGSVPLLAAAAAQVGVIRWLDRAPARRPMVVRLAAAQALVWAPMVALVLWAPPWVLPALVVGTLAYFALGAAALPPWTSWMGDLVPVDGRGAYFGRRERDRLIAHLAAVIAGGAGLALAAERGHEALGFAGLFVAAGLARAVSARVHTVVYEPPYVPPARERTFDFPTFLRRAPGNNFGRFTLLVALLHLAVNIAAPFFTLYMLRELGFGYAAFMWTTVVATLAQVAGFPTWGRLGDRIGNRAVLVLATFGTATVPLCWLAADGLLAVLAIQVLAGVAWSGVLMASGNFLFDAVMPDRRGRCAAYLNACVNVGLCIGALIGGAIAVTLADRPAWVPTACTGRSVLPFLFVASAVGRLAVALALPFAVREVRPVPPRPAWLQRVYLVGAMPLRALRLHPLRRPRGAPPIPGPAPDPAPPPAPPPVPNAE